MHYYSICNYTRVDAEVKTRKEELYIYYLA